MVVNDLMDRTFAMRRREIVEISCDVLTLFGKFPFLQDPEQVRSVLNILVQFFPFFAVASERT